MTDEKMKTQVASTKIVDMYGRPYRHNRVLASGYSNAGASLTKNVFKGFAWEGGSPDDDIVSNLPILRQRSRQLTMEAPIIAGMYQTLSTYTVGTGLEPEPIPDAEFIGMPKEHVKKWKDNALRYWRYFAESQDCDAYHRDNFYEQTRLVSRSADESGDVFVTMPRFTRRNSMFALKLQVIEADCCANPDASNLSKPEHKENDVYGGVELSHWGNVVGYWFYTGHPLASRRPRSFTHLEKKYPRWVFVPAYGSETGLPNVLHIMESIRPNQRRGLPIISPVIELALTLDRYMKAEAIAAQIQAMFTLIVTSDVPEGTAGEMSAMAGEEGAAAAGDDDTIIALGNGIVQYTKPGQGVTPVQSTRPNAAFGTFVESGLKMMGASLLPYELMVQAFGEAYSATIAAFNMASTKFKIRRGRLVGDYCQPIWGAWMDEAVLRGYIEAPGYFENPVMRLAYQRCKWSGIGMPQVSLLDSVKAAGQLMALGLSTGEEQARELTGSDFMENISIRSREIEATKAAGFLEGAAKGFTGQTAQEVAREKERSTSTGDGSDTSEEQRGGQARPQQQQQGGEDIQSLALNGAQIQALQAIVTGVSDGSYSIDTGKAMCRLAFPTASESQIDAIFDSISKTEAA